MVQNRLIVNDLTHMFINIYLILLRKNILGNKIYLNIKLNFKIYFFLNLISSSIMIIRPPALVYARKTWIFRLREKYSNKNILCNNETIPEKQSL